MIFDVYRLFEKNKKLAPDDAFRLGRANLVLERATRTATVTLKDGSEAYSRLEVYEVHITTKGMVITGTEVVQYSLQSEVHRYRQGRLCKHPGEKDGRLHLDLSRNTAYLFIRRQRQLQQTSPKFRTRQSNLAHPYGQ